MLSRFGLTADSAAGDLYQQKYDASGTGNGGTGNADLDNFIKIALGQEGYHEIGNNSTKYNDWYYGKPVSGDAYPWCAVFVSWCANQAGIMNSVVPSYAGCWGGADYYQKNERYFQPSDNNKPKAGDVFFHGMEHTGIIVAYDPNNNCVYTVEGNADNQVEVLKRPMSFITSYGSNGGQSNGVIPSKFGNTNGRMQ